MESALQIKYIIIIIIIIIILINTQKKIHMEMVVSGGPFDKWLSRLP